MAISLEPENAHAMNAGGLECVVESVGNRAKIFAYNDRAMPLRLQSQQPQQIS